MWYYQLIMIALVLSFWLTMLWNLSKHWYFYSKQRLIKKCQIKYSCISYGLNSRLCEQLNKISPVPFAVALTTSTTVTTSYKQTYFLNPLVGMSKRIFPLKAQIRFDVLFIHSIGEKVKSCSAIKPH